jgi:hypothetical protein
LTATKFEPVTFSVSGFTLSYIANMFILMILYEVLLLAQFYYLIIYTQKVDSRAHIADQCASWKISSGTENLVLQVLQF